MSKYIYPKDLFFGINELVNVLIDVYALAKTQNDYINNIQKKIPNFDKSIEMYNLLLFIVPFIRMNFSLINGQRLLYDDKNLNVAKNIIKQNQMASIPGEILSSDIIFIRNSLDWQPFFRQPIYIFCNP